MKRALALSCIVCVACGGTPPPAETSEREATSTREVRVAEDATVAELLRAIRGALIARGHEGECFLAWDVEDASDGLTVYVGERSRQAAVSCDGLQGVATALEGRCPFVRFFWIAGEDMRTEALTFYFAPAGRAYASRPVAAAGVSTPAADAVFRQGPEGTRLVLGLPLPRREGASKKEAGAEEDAESDNPLEDPEIMQGVQQVVARIQSCNPSGQGSLVLEWAVEPDGTITGVQSVTSTVEESAIECAVGILSAASFPEHEGDDPVDYCVPVLLDPSLRPSDQAGRGE